MITATILSNGNAGTIGAAVASIVAAVDRVVLVDTGIADDTIGVAWRAAGEKLVLRRLAWPNDFSAARNYCLRAAGDLGATWCLHFDSDEILHGQLTVPDDPAVDLYLIADASRTYYLERLIRVDSAAVWRGRTHEFVAEIGPPNRRILPGVSIEGQPKTPEQLREKFQRDREALTAMVDESPHDPRWCYYLGQTLEDLGELVEAVLAYRACWNLSGWSEQAAWAAYRASVCMARRSLYQNAIDACIAGMGKDDRFPELAWHAGWNCYQLGRYADAAHWARHALAITAAGRCNDRIGFRFLPGWKERPENLLEWCAKQKTGA